MKKIFVFTALLAFWSLSLLNSCAPTKAIADKSGVQLWAENCNRCHNAPTQDQYTKDQWVVIGTHMKLKAGLTNDEKDKIVAFLQGG